MSDNLSMVRALFGLDTDNPAELFVGVYDPEVSWNGWACPLFQRPEVERIIAWWALEPAESNPVFAWDGDTLVITEAEGPDVFTDRFTPTEHGYYLGGAWRWSVFTDVPEGADLERWRDDAAREGEASYVDGAYESGAAHGWSAANYAEAYGDPESREDQARRRAEAQIAYHAEHWRGGFIEGWDRFISNQWPDGSEMDLDNEPENAPTS